MFGLLKKTRISGAEAREKVAGGAVLVDVRSPAEFASGHLDGARNIPLGALRSRLDELSADAEVVVYCASGMRSASAAKRLRSAGFTAHNLGPLRAW
ncbi:MAG: rhodanese-like domain-containing protein [Myxococcota bacterium]|nr:rhodanese-like domain-containing protein [Myxococcota bacterium]